MALKNEITDNTPLWWEIQNIPTEIVRELRRRNNSNNIGMNMPSPFTNVTFNFENNYKNYKGPLSPWVRIFSNSTGKAINGLVPKSKYLEKNGIEVDYDGFILSGGEGFYNAYGYTPGKQFGSKDSNVAILGYQANGQPHFIDNRYRSQLMYEAPTDSRFPQNNQASSIIPPPAIVNVNVKQSKEYLTYGKFSFKCFGLAQLEYLTPFFLTPGINLFIEFGWNLFNQKSLINLSSIDECLDIIEKPQTAIDRGVLSNGNYGCITGIITKYNFSTQDGFVYDCNVETISRQGLYAGMRTDNNAKIDIKTDGNDLADFVSLKTFIKTYLPSINQVLESERRPIDFTGPLGMPGDDDNLGNFLNYIVKKSSSTPTTKNQKDAKANAQQLQQPNDIVNQLKTSTLFYDGNTEDRVFTGRLQSIYKKSKTANDKEPVIQYGTVNNFQQISDANLTLDFDSNDGATEVWLQLDFVFEMINLFMSNLKTKQFLIDISDIIINAHPNLISCDKNVLIGNPIAPKINKGTPSRPNVPGKGGFLKIKEGQPLLPGSNTSEKSYADENPFFVQKADITEKRNTQLDQQIKDNILDYDNLTPEQSLYIAYEAARKTFKTFELVRDDLDIIINYLYYNINSRDPIKDSAAFPFKNDVKVKRKGKDGKEIEVTYKKYYYGYLKHIYISKEKLIDIAKSEETKNYKQFINAILNVINEAFDNFWKFEIQEGIDSEGRSILSIIDKNTINYDALKEIYTFELAKTNNVVRNINFDVSLSNEQAVNVQFGGPNSANLTEKLTSGLKTDVATTLNIINNTPILKFTDRLDKEQLKKLAESLKGSVDTTLTPGTSSGLINDNNDIRDLQTYGPKLKDSVLIVTVKNIKDEKLLNVRTQTIRKFVPTQEQIRIYGPNVTEGQVPIGQQQFITVQVPLGYTDANLSQINNNDENTFNFKMLCLPPTLKGKLRQMLDDGDLKNNIAKYSGVADNFTITLTFDGIFALRNLQCFAISNLPKPYVPGNVVFQVLEVEHNIVGGSWKTEVTALVRCIGSSKLEYIIV
jgi:hypothetical protein